MNFLNIGLEFNDGTKREWNLDEVIRALYFHNIDFYAIEIQRPELGEPTAVVSVKDSALDYSVLMLSKTLRQDCIAMWGRDEPGVLIGDLNHKWLPFNPKRFLLPKVVEQHIIDKLA